jgi:ATP-dependent protease ClpP protease subunit
MSVTVEKRGDEYCVVRGANSQGDEHTIACYATRSAAERRRNKEAGAQARADGQRDWFRFVTNRATPKKAEIYIYGDIGATYFDESGVSVEDFVAQLDELDDVKALDVRINSPGGSAWDGMTIANAIIRHPAKVTTWIDGLAASAASLVAVAGDEVVTSKYGQAMLHNAHAVAMGTAKDMREIASQLDNLNASMAAYYADRAGGDAATWSRAMTKESWYNADEMLEAGLATRIDTSGVREEVEAAVASAMAGTAEEYRYRGRTAAPAPVVRATNTTKESRMADKKSLAASLGLPDDATDEDILAATRKALGADGGDGDEDDGDEGGEGAPEAPTTPEKPIVDAPPEPAKVPAGAAARADDGTVTLDSAAYASLKAAAELGARAHATLQAQADARVVDQAIDDGRITPARRNHYLALMVSDRADTTDLLTKRLSPGAAVPMTEMGHSADASPSAAITEDPIFKSWKVG